jgi:hypothetical protein
MEHDEAVWFAKLRCFLTGGSGCENAGFAPSSGMQKAQLWCPQQPHDQFSPHFLGRSWLHLDVEARMFGSDTYRVKRKGDQWVVTKNWLHHETFDSQSEAQEAASLAVKRSVDGGRWARLG